MQNSKIRFNLCTKVFLFGLRYDEAPSASYWAIRSIENYLTVPLPTNFKELKKIPLDKTYNFLMSLVKNSIDKVIERVVVEALMFWELPKSRMH